MKNQIRVLVIEDNRAFSQSLKETLQAAPDMQWIAAYRRGEDAYKSLQEAPGIKADVVLLDLNLPDCDGLSLVPFLKRRFPEGEIIVLTQADDHLKTLEAIRLGVSGYILKNTSIHTIWETIREVSAGGCIIDPRLSKAVLKVLTSDTSPEEKILSKREIEILEQLALGKVKKEIAESLGLSIHTVTGYTENLYKKLQVKNVAAAVATAIRKGII